MKKIGARLAVAAVTGALVAAPQVPAFAATRTTVTISITAKSALPKVTRDVWVIYRSSWGSATISGTISTGTAGQAVQLFAQRFRAKMPTPLGSPVVLSTTGTALPYSFKVTPTLATHYTVELFTDSTESMPALATSAPATVYVAAHHKFSGGNRCARPTCHETYHLRVVLPASALRTEKAKKWYVYFGIRYSRTGIPLPRTLRLGAGHVHVSPPRRISSHAFAVTLTFSFFIGNRGARWAFFPCTKDTEAKDGLGLPGHHGCGTLRTVSINRVYLG